MFKISNCRNWNLSGKWTAVKPAVDLETTPLELKTDSTLGSRDEIDIIFHNSLRQPAGCVEIHFDSTPKYWLYWCTGSPANFPSTLPTAVDKVWRISLTRTSDIRLQIHCNDLEVLSFLLSDETCDRSDWRDYWSRDIERLLFFYEDTASDYYRLYQHGEGNTI